MPEASKVHSRDNLITGVLLINLGSPDKPDARSVRRYLSEFLQDRRVIELPRFLWLLILYLCILPLRSARVARLYAAIWKNNKAPLITMTERLTCKLAKKYTAQKNLRLAFAMRYGNPSIKHVLEQWHNQGLEKLIVIPLYPQYAASTIGSTFDKLSSIFAGWRWLPQLHFVSGYHANQMYIDAIAASLANSNDYLLISFHGLPRAMLEKGDPYYCCCQSSARLIAEKLQLADDQWQICFQSRFGRQPWLTPYTDELLQKLPQMGITRVRIVCPGFSIDCLETLSEIAIEYKSLFLAAGGEQLHYVPCLNDSSEHCQLMQSLIDPLLLAGKSTFAEHAKEREERFRNKRAQLFL